MSSSASTATRGGSGFSWPRALTGGFGMLQLSEEAAFWSS